MLEYITLKDAPMGILPTQVAKFVDLNESVVAIGYDGFVLDSLTSLNPSVFRVVYSDDKEVPGFFTRLTVPLLITHHASIRQILVYTGVVSHFIMSIVNKWAQLQKVGDSLVIYGNYAPKDLVEMKINISDRSYACITDNHFTIFAGVKVIEASSSLHRRD